MRLRLFGSVARGDHGADSDVDILVDFDQTNGGVSLLDLVRLENRLSDLLGVRVDLVQGKSLKSRVRCNAEREAVLAFNDPVQPLQDILENIIASSAFCPAKVLSTLLRMNGRCSHLSMLC